MTSSEDRVRKVATILRDWRGSDAAAQAPASDVAADIDRAYAEHLASLPERSRAIRDGRAAWERKVG